MSKKSRQRNKEILAAIADRPWCSSYEQIENRNNLLQKKTVVEEVEDLLLIQLKKTQL
jgi:hypothetical protein